MDPLESIRDEAHGASYPRELLKGNTALVLFCAAFLGKQDAVWIADAGLIATCVDVDAAKLDEMKTMYPRVWKFVVDDVYSFADDATRTWDVVSLDPPTNHFEEVAELVNVWCSLSDKLVVFGSSLRSHESVVAPLDWIKHGARMRSTFAGGTYWTVLERA